MLFLPRSTPGRLALLLLVALGAAMGALLWPRVGPLGFGLLALILGSIVVVVAEAWRADVWRGSRPPDRIQPGQVPDYLVWRVRHRASRGRSGDGR